MPYADPAKRRAQNRRSVKRYRDRQREERDQLREALEQIERAARQALAFPEAGPVVPDVAKRQAEFEEWERKNAHVPDE